MAEENYPSKSIIYGDNKRIITNNSVIIGDQNVVLGQGNIILGHGNTTSNKYYNVICGSGRRYGDGDHLIPLCCEAMTVLKNELLKNRPV